MAVSTYVKNFNDGVISLADGTGTPVTLTAPMTNGDLTISGLAETQKEVVVYQSRGVLNTVRHTNKTFTTGSFSFKLADYSSSDAGNISDFALKLNAYSANVSTLPLGADEEVYCIQITLTVDGPGAEADHTVVLDDCHCTVDLSEGDPNTGTLNFTVYGSVTIT